MKSKQHFAPPPPSLPILSFSSSCLAGILLPQALQLAGTTMSWRQSSLLFANISHKDKDFCVLMLRFAFYIFSLSHFNSSFFLFCGRVWFVLLLIEWSYLVFGRGYIRVLRQSSLGLPASCMDEAFKVMKIPWVNVKNLSFYMLSTLNYEVYIIS